MLKFTTSLGVALISLFGLFATLLGLFLISIPRPTDIRSCLTTEMHKVRLCPEDAGYVRLKEISPHLKNAVIVSEDSSFYSHNGLDFHELKESFQTNWERGRWARGGSTITQQLAKNVYLSADKSILRKIKEAIISVQIEKELSKDEILEKYLNIVEFGPDVFGIKKASRHYFNKSPAGLTPAEGAFLAFLLPSPKKYSVSFRKKKLTPFARGQTRKIVTRLHRYKRISTDEYHQALLDLDILFGGSLEPLPSSEVPAAVTEEEGETIYSPSLEESFKDDEKPAEGSEEDLEPDEDSGHSDSEGEF